MPGKGSIWFGGINGAGIFPFAPLCDAPIESVFFFFCIMLLYFVLHASSRSLFQNNKINNSLRSVRSSNYFALAIQHNIGLVRFDPNCKLANVLDPLSEFSDHAARWFARNNIVQFPNVVFVIRTMLQRLFQFLI